MSEVSGRRFLAIVETETRQEDYEKELLRSTTEKK